MTWGRPWGQARVAACQRSHHLGGLEREICGEERGFYDESPKVKMIVNSDSVKGRVRGDYISISYDHWAGKEAELIKYLCVIYFPFDNKEIQM